MSNQQQTKQQKNALRHVGATAPPRQNCMETEEEKNLNLFLPQVLYTNKMSNQQQTKQQKNALRHVGATAPPRPNKKEEDKEQYKKICDAGGCYTILDIDTPIMCYMNKQNGDKTLCRVCYEDGDYQEDDENSDNEEEEEEEEENKCWGNNKCERDEFGCCIVCCECKNCIKRIKEELADEEHKEQYKKICDEEECDTILDIDTPIMCYMNEENGDKTLCRVCYEDGDYKEDDENSDNEEEE